ncbi:MAG: UDP-N-acetylmuramoyl-L-alanine--D-glutamate ligase [Armatimonadetes bacterium]|nr:UDP-N-acetylmuramoyl-L-alanine--D-glutamate ligase [Armatimonadota bacterium]
MALKDIPAERVAVCGAGYSGQAITRTLRRMGKQVVVTDSRPAEKLEAAARVFADLEAEVHYGAHDEAVLAGTDLVVVSPGVPFDTPSLVSLRQRGVPVWGEVELAARLSDARLVGVTGTKGKSTTCALVSLMLDAPLANSEAYAARGVPLVELLADNPDAPVVVVEITSYQLESIETLRLWVAALLNIAEDHTDRHPTRESYIAVKSRIFENQQADDRSVYNLDDPAVRAVGERLKTTRIGVSEREEPELGVWSTPEGIFARLPQAVGGFAGRLAGWDAVAPALRVLRPSLLAALGTALMAGADVAAARRVVSEFEGLPHRMERVREWRGLTFVNDSKATNPLATENAIRQSPAPVVLIAGGQTKGIDLAPLAEPFRRLRALVLIGQDARLLGAVAGTAGVRAVRYAADLEAAVGAAVELAEPGDWVVLSPCGASFDMFENFAARGERFREIVHALPG